MQTIDIPQAKMQLATLIEQVEAGEEVQISRGGKPVAKLVPIKSNEKTRRVLGQLGGKLKIPADFDAPLPEEILASFEGR